MKNEIIITHLLVKGFGWENTILIKEDFERLEKLGENKEDGLVLLGKQHKSNKLQILKGYEK